MYYLEKTRTEKPSSRNITYAKIAQMIAKPPVVLISVGALLEIGYLERFIFDDQLLFDVK